jgi:type VI secretion system secreted protein VgrG
MFEDKKSGEIIRMHAEKDHEVTILNKETTEIGERFMPPKGSASREHTIKNGDDNLTIDMGDQNLTISLGDQTNTISLGNQTTTVMQNVSTSSMLSNTTTVVASSISMSPASIDKVSPMISLTAAATISITAPIINITGIVNLTGMLNITGGITVNTMVPVLIPA